MKKHIIWLIKHPLIIGSTLLFVGSIVSSAINYLFNLGMGRLLSVGDYGVFATLVSLFNIFSVFAIALMMVFSKLAATLVAKRKDRYIGSLITIGNLWVGIISFAICGVLIIFSGQIAEFLNIKSQLLIIITVAALLFSLLTSVPQGVLQGLLKFVSFSFVNIASSLFKLLIGIALVLIGFKAEGAIIAFFISSFIGYVFSFVPLITFLKVKAKEKFTLSSLHNEIFSYSIPVFLSNVGIISLISVDIILVKHYFSSQVAGQYAALSLMGRSIFYLVQPIVSVLFPLIVQKKERNEGFIGTLILSAILIGLPSILVSSIYFLFPGFILKVFFPKAIYLSLTPYLGPFSIFILIYAFCYLLNSFYLSVGKTKVTILTIGAAILEAILIVLFHNNINQVILDITSASFLLLFSLLIYYRNAIK